jgi:peptide/nickel transport system permease protein
VKKAFAFLGEHRLFTFFAAMAVLVVTVAVLSPLIVPYDPYDAVTREALQPPGAEHWFGTDKLGRDLFSRVICASRTSLFSAFLLVTCVTVIGSALGIIAGYFGGAADSVIMRVSDMMISFPGLVLAIAIAGILGPSLTNAIIAVTAVSWTKYARLSRSLVLKIKSKDYVAAGKLSGSKTKRMLFRYMLPTSLPTLLITATMDIGKMMLELAALCFLGFGAQPPTPEWGLMMNEGRLYLQTAPWLLIFPGAAMFVVVVIFNMLGDSLRDIMDPRHRRAGRRRKEVKHA